MAGYYINSSCQSYEKDWQLSQTCWVCGSEAEGHPTTAWVVVGVGLGAGSPADHLHGQAKADGLVVRTHDAWGGLKSVSFVSEEEAEGFARAVAARFNPVHAAAFGRGEDDGIQVVPAPHAECVGVHWYPS